MRAAALGLFCGFLGKWLPRKLRGASRLWQLGLAQVSEGSNADHMMPFLRAAASFVVECAIIPAVVFAAVVALLGALQRRGQAVDETAEVAGRSPRAIAFFAALVVAGGSVLGVTAAGRMLVLATETARVVEIVADSLAMLGALGCACGIVFGVWQWLSSRGSVELRDR